MFAIRHCGARVCVNHKKTKDEETSPAAAQNVIFVILVLCVRHPIVCAACLSFDVDNSDLYVNIPSKRE